MADYTEGGIPKRELTLQYQPLVELGEDSNTPSVADGTEITLYAETIKEIFQKEPTTIPIQKGEDTHFEGDKSLIVDTLKAKHKFEISAWVYSGKQGKHSLDDGITGPNGDEAQITTQTITANEFDKFIPLGDTGIKYLDDETHADAETVKAVDDSGNTTELSRGTDYKINYSRGEIKFFNTANINTSEETIEFLGNTISTTTVISDDFEITYTFDARAKNIARLIRRMSQLGNPLAMRLDKDEFSAPTGETDAHEYLVIPKKVTINTQSEKPDEYKVELELRKGTIEQ